MKTIRFSNGWELSVPDGVYALPEGEVVKPIGPVDKSLPPGAYLVTPSNGTPAYLQGWKFIPHGEPVGKNAEGQPIDAQGNPAGPKPSLSGDPIAMMLEEKSLQWGERSFNGYGYERIGQPATGNYGGGSVSPLYSVGVGGSFDVPMPIRANGQSKTRLRVPLGKFTLTFVIPGDEPNSHNIGYVSIISKPAPDRFGAVLAVRDGLLVLRPEQQYAGAFQFNFRVGAEGGDGVPALQRGRTYTIDCENLIGDEWWIDVARPSRYA